MSTTYEIQGGANRYLQTVFENLR